jgi:hypothetical protein
MTDDGIVIAEETLAALWRDAQHLFADHCENVGEARDAHHGKNVALMFRLADIGAFHVMTARCNGRVFGYLCTLISPSLEAVGLLVGVQTLFFASRDAAGMNLGPRLQRASIEALRAKGVGEIYMRAGIRGAGPRLGALYQRLGAQGFGSLYKLSLKAA